MASNTQYDIEIVIEAQNKAQKQLAGVSRELKNIQGTTKSAASSIKAFGDRNKETFESMRNTGAIAFGLLSVGIGKATKEASNLEESINAVNVVFKDGSDDILKYSKQAVKSTGMTQSAFNQMATITGALLKGTSDDMSEVADTTFDLQKRAADMASVFNTEVDDAMSAINQAIRGETEAIRRYAGDVTDATLQNYLLSQGIKTQVKDMTQAEKRIARVNLIMEQTKDTAGDFANTSNSLANQQRLLGAELNDMLAVLGSSFIPIFQDVLSVVRPVIQSIREWIQENPELARNILLVTTAIAGLVTVVGLLGLALPAIATGIALLTGPIGLVIGAVALLATARTTNFMGIQETTAQAWEWIKTTFAEGLNFIKTERNRIFGETSSVTQQEMQQIMGVLRVTWSVIKGIFQVGFVYIKTVVKTSRETLKFLFKNGVSIISSIMKLLVDTVRNQIAFIKAIFRGDFKGAWDIVKKQVKDVGAFFQNIFSGIITSAKQRGKNMIGMFADGLTEGITVVKGKIVEIAQTLKDYLGFGSPTKKGPGSESGNWIPNFIGMLSDGLNDGKTPVRRQAEAIAQELGDGLAEVDLENYITRVEQYIEQKNEDLAESFNTIKDSGQQAFDAIGDSMIKSFDKIADFDKKIGDVEGKIKGLGIQTSGSVATEFVKVQQELAKLQQDQVALQGTDGSELKQAENIAKQKQLEEELALAKANTTEEEIKRAQMIAEESGVEKILREAGEKKAILEAELTELRDRKGEEEQVFKDLAQKKIEFERQYLEALDLSTQRQVQQYNTLINKARELRAVRGGEYVPTTGTQPIQTTDNSFSVNLSGINATIREEADVNKVADALAKKIERNRAFNIR